MKLAALIRLLDRESKALGYYPRIAIEWDAQKADSPLQGYINRPFNGGRDWLIAVFFTMQADGTITSIRPSAAYGDEALTDAINKLKKA